MAEPFSKLPKALWQLVMCSNSSENMSLMMCVCCGPVSNCTSQTDSQQEPSGMLAHFPVQLLWASRQMPLRKWKSMLKSNLFSSGFILLWFLVLVLCTTAQVVLAQIKVKEGFKPALPLDWEISATIFLASSRAVGEVPKPQRVSNTFQTLLEVAK